MQNSLAGIFDVSSLVLYSQQGAVRHICFLIYRCKNTGSNYLFRTGHSERLWASRKCIRSSTENRPTRHVPRVLSLKTRTLIQLLQPPSKTVHIPVKRRAMWQHWTGTVMERSMPRLTVSDVLPPPDSSVVAAARALVRLLSLESPINSANEILRVAFRRTGAKDGMNFR